MVLWATDPFTVPGAAAREQNAGTPTTRITKQPLSAQLILPATLGYAGSYTVDYLSPTSPNSNHGPPSSSTTDPPADPPPTDNGASPTDPSSPGNPSGRSNPACSSHPSTPTTTTIPPTTTTTVPPTTTTTTVPPTTTTVRPTTTTVPARNTTTTTTAPGRTTTTAAAAPSATTTTHHPSPGSNPQNPAGRAPSPSTPRSPSGGEPACGSPHPGTANGPGTGRPGPSGQQGPGPGSQSPHGSQPSGSSGSPSGSNQPPEVFTDLPSAGQVVEQGQSLYAVNGTSVVLLYGSTPAWRTLSEGDSGVDVEQLNADLVALGDATRAQLDPTSDYFGTATAVAVEKLQATLGAPRSGALSLGRLVFLPTPARITSVTAGVGASAQPGASVLTATSTTRQVTATIDATEVAVVKVGDHATLTLPDGQTTPAVVASIGTVATAPPGGNPGSSSTPTIQLGLTAADPVATGRVDQAPVTVTITTATLNRTLAVPVTALVATPDGRVAIDVIDSDGLTRPVDVTPGLFDDANGLIQISGPDLAAAERVALPDQGKPT